MNGDLPDNTKMNEAQTPCSPDEVHTDFCFPNKLSRMTQHLHVPGEDLRFKNNLSLLSTPKMKPLPILLLASFIWMITAMQVIAQEEGGAIATL